MKRFLSSFFKIGLVLLLSFVLIGTRNKAAISSDLQQSPEDRMNQQPVIRGVWIMPSSLYTKEKVDRALERVFAGGFNTIFACVFYQGQTLYESGFAKTHGGVQRGFNPLEYLVAQAHLRNIKVHAWFVSGNVGKGVEGPLLVDHPDWKLIGPDGDSYGWLNFSIPAVQQFFGDLSSEVVQRYGVDGVHLDYIRYPDPEWGFDPYTMATFQQESGLDANLLRYPDLPAYGLLSGNPLTNPSTATVLANFSNGYPAVTLNQYGAGEVILLNWEAGRRNLAVNSEILKRSIQRLLHPGGGIFLLHSATNAGRYGYENLNQAKTWLADLGWGSQEVEENGVSNLDPNSILVLPGIYLITPQTAAQMAEFVNRGGGMILIDGPTRSISLPEIQALTGMQSRGKYFRASVMMTATGEHPLIPTSQREPNIELFQSWDAKWKDFRRKGVTLTVQEVYQRIHSVSSDTTLSTVIPVNPISSYERKMQDWSTWLQMNSVDVLMLLLYVDQVEELRQELDVWKFNLPADPPLVIGLISYTGGDQARIPKPPEQLIAELRVLRQSGITNFSIYDLDSLTDAQLATFAADAQANQP